MRTLRDKKSMKTHELWRQILSAAVLSEQVFGWKSPFVNGALLVARSLSPIQYFIILGVNRLNRSDGWCVSMIRHTVHGVHTAKGQRFFLILSIDWKD